MSRSWTAILLAGERPGENDFAASHGVASKALIPVGGEAMLGRVARTLLKVDGVNRILVLAQQPEALFQGPLAWMAEEPRIGTAASGDGIAVSIDTVAGSVAPFPILVTTADHALLTLEMIEAFIRGSDGNDVAVALVERHTVEAAYPETKRTWLRFRGGDYTGANLFALRTPASQAAVSCAIPSVPRGRGGMVDTGDSKSPGRKAMPVRVRPPLPVPVRGLSRF